MKKTIFGGLILVLFVLVNCLGTASASIPNHFISTDGNSNSVNINFNGIGLKDGWYFGVFDYNEDPSSGLDLLKGNSSIFYETGTFTVTQTGSDYYINVTQGVDAGSSIDIGNSGDFSFYFFDGTNTYDTSFLIEGSSPTYFFSSTDGGNVVGIDLAPVPIPASSILLLSGLIGLVALGGRRKKQKGVV